MELTRPPSWLERLGDLTARDAQHKATDPWKLRLERVKGKIDFSDGLERVSTQELLDLLRVPWRNRTSGTCRRLSSVMVELGWTATRLHGPTRGGFRDLTRGYAPHPHSAPSGN
jgi:hypothetical protein